MMNKKRTRTNGMLRYALLLPLVSMLTIGATFTSKTTVAQEKTGLRKTAEVMPEFPGGNQALFTYMIEQIKYPKDAEKAGIEGKVLVKFVVDVDGKIIDVEAKNSVHPSIDKQAIGVVSNMPIWSAGKQDGKPVKVEMVLPIAYKLTNEPKGKKKGAKG